MGFHLGICGGNTGGARRPKPAGAACKRGTSRATKRATLVVPSWTRRPASRYAVPRRRASRGALRVGTRSPRTEVARGDRGFSSTSALAGSTSAPTFYAVSPVTSRAWTGAPVKEARSGDAHTLSNGRFRSTLKKTGPGTAVWVPSAGAFGTVGDDSGCTRWRPPRRRPRRARPCPRNGRGSGCAVTSGVRT